MLTTAKAIMMGSCIEAWEVRTDGTLGRYVAGVAMSCKTPVATLVARLARLGYVASNIRDGRVWL